jgi:hypothetical protein
MMDKGKQEKRSLLDEVADRTREFLDDLDRLLSPQPQQRPARVPVPIPVPPRRRRR